MACFTLQQQGAAGEEPINGDVFDVFNQFLSADAPTSSTQAAFAVSQLAPAPNGGSKVLDDGFFFSLWKDVIRIVEQIPDDHPAMDRVVRFMRELTLLPDTGLQVLDVSHVYCIPVNSLNDH